MKGWVFSLILKFIKMKIITKTVSLLAVVVILTAGNPILAKIGETTSASASRGDDDDGDNGKWGLLGLAGLLGLLGLKRRDDDGHRNTSSNR